MVQSHSLDWTSALNTRLIKHISSLFGNAECSAEYSDSAKCIRQNIRIRQKSLFGTPLMCTPPPSTQVTQLALRSGSSKLDCTGLKIDPFRNRWACITVLWLILKWKSHAIVWQKDILTFFARIFVNLCKIIEKLRKLRKKILFQFDFSFLKKTNLKFEKKKFSVTG